MMMIRLQSTPPKKKSGRRQAKPDLSKNAEIFPNFTTSLEFARTVNPRLLREIQPLLLSPLPRESLDRIAGCSSGPALIALLRDLGLKKEGLRCTMVPDWGRDGCPIRRGVYSLSKAARPAVNGWLQKGQGGSNGD